MALTTWVLGAESNWTYDPFGGVFTGRLVEDLLEKVKVEFMIEGQLEEGRLENYLKNGQKSDEHFFPISSASESRKFRNFYYA